MPDTYFSFVFGYLSLWVMSFALLGVLLLKTLKLEKDVRFLAQKLKLEEPKI